VNVAVCPAVTVWFVGWVVIVGATGATFAVKFTPVTSTVLTVAFWLAGVKV
jgi:hypothetical protein